MLKQQGFLESNSCKEDAYKLEVAKVTRASVDIFKIMKIVSELIKVAIETRETCKWHQ